MKKLVTSVPNLAIVETVDSPKLAAKLNTEYCKLEHRKDKLPVLVQVNVSGEYSKHGVVKGQVIPLCDFIRNKCPWLRFSGLMAMGKVNDLEGFLVMTKLKDTIVAHAKEINGDDFILSMGTSADF